MSGHTSPLPMPQDSDLTQWIDWAHHVDWRIRAAVAGNRSTPPKVLAWLAEDPQDFVRITVAGNAHTPKPVLKRLAEADDWRIRAEVAHNPHAAAWIIARLACDRVLAVRQETAAHPKLPSDSLALLACESSPYLHCLLAEHHGVSDTESDG